MRAHLFIWIVLFILISSCGSPLEKERKAAKAVAEQLSADKVNIAFKEYSDTDGRDRKDIILSLDRFKNITEEEFNKRITSTAALLYLKQFDETIYNDYDYINIKLGDKFEKTYRLQDMIDIENLLSCIQKFISATNENNFEQIREQVDAGSIPDSVLLGLAKFISEIDSSYGKASHVSIAGFGFDTWKASKEPVLVAWAQTKHTNSTTDYKFAISRSSKKIVYVGVNESD